MAPPPKLAVTFPSTSALQWHPAMAPSNGTPSNGNTSTTPSNRTASTPSKLVVTRPAHYNGTLQWHHPLSTPQHTTMAPCNGTQQWHHVRSPTKLPSPPHHSTLQWHPAMAPSNGTTSAPQGWSSPSPSTIVRYNGTLRWHPAMAPRPLPKWFVALPPIGSKNPYSYRYLGKKSPAEISERGHYFVQRPMFYIGSTKVGVCHREYNRHTQFNRYKKGKAIQVELAIRWWASQDNYSQFSIIALKHFDTYAEAWTYEHALIEQMKAPLNHPLISKHPTRNAFKYVYKPDKRNFVGIESRHRLFKTYLGAIFNIERITYQHSYF